MEAPPQPARTPENPEAIVRLDSAFDLAYFTPLHEYRSGADTKASGILTLLGVMFTVLVRLSAPLMRVLGGGGALALLCGALLAGFVLLSLVAGARAFHTISPRFPPA